MSAEISLRVNGMHCASCVGRAEAALSSQPGVVSVAINLANGTARIRAQGAEPARLAQALTDAGYPSQVRRSAADRINHGVEAAAMWRRFWVAFALTLPVFLVEMGGHLFPPVHHFVMSTVGMQTSWLMQFLLISIVLAWPGAVFFRIGFPALARGAPEMNTLVALGAGAAWLYSTCTTFLPNLLPAESRVVYFESAGVIVTLILLGRALEARAKGQAGAAIEALMSLRPRTATVVVDGLHEVRALDDLQVGDLVLAKPGEAFAVDGVVTEGTGPVDQSMLSGEAIPVEKSAGDTVHAGTLNLAAALTYRTTATGEDTTLGRIVEMVDAAQAAKMPVQAQIDKITRVFVPIVIGLALLTLAAWMAFGGALAQAVVAAVSVLIIACPCAMGLATPVSIVVSTGRAAQLGILFRGGDALQRLSEAKSIAFDKTGTLTKGHLEVHGWNDIQDQALRTRIAALEAQSEHPIAKAIAAMEQVDPLTVRDFKAEAGRGASGSVEGHSLVVGTRVFHEELGIETSHILEDERTILARGETPILVSEDGEAKAVLSVADTEKEEARDVIAQLKSLGLSCAMISGDRDEVARAVGQRLHLDNILSEVLPDAKRDAIAALQADGPVAFVGDGINDAPALAQADIGLAMGTGTDVAMESADVVLMSGNLNGVPKAFSLSAATMRNIKQNLFWAFAYNVALIPIAMGVFYPAFGLQLSPMLGAFAMAMSSVFVVTNALRLRYAE